MFKKQNNRTKTGQIDSQSFKTEITEHTGISEKSDLNYR